MQAIIQDGYGKPECVLRLRKIEVPSIGAGDVLIRVRATSVNTGRARPAPRIGRGQGGYRPDLPARQSSKGRHAHAGASCQREDRHHGV